MTLKSRRKKYRGWTVQHLLAVLCAVLLTVSNAPTYAQQATQRPDSPMPQDSDDLDAPKLPNDQLDALVAPIALYPDPLLSQVLVASTYPLEVIQLQQWMAQHKDLKGEALVAAVEKEDWDPSIQGMAALPDAVKQLAENIKWTTDLGNAFLSQQSEVMDAIQRMRAKAKDAGNLKSNEQMKVETKVVETKTVVVIEQASPEIVYVPSYNPVVVYGPPIYPYPPIVYPPPGYYAAGVAISFGIGVAMGAAWGGGWGYGCGWGSNNNITINNNNNFVNHNNRTNINNGNRNNINNGNRGGNSNWQHNPQHRGGAPYSNRAAATKYGGSTRGDSMSTRQAKARQNQGQPGGGRQQAGTMDRGGASRQQPGASNRAGSNGASRANSTSGNRSSGGGNNIGNRQVPSNNSSRNTSAFGGSSSKARAQSTSSRGASSMGASRGGGGRSGGGRRR
jgi:hypothetical protein